MRYAFPENYVKPVLFGIVNAQDSGWSAKCASGGVPTTGWNNCTNGPNVGQGQPCPGHGHGNSTNRLYGSGSSSGVLDPNSVGRGL